MGTRVLAEGRTAASSHAQQPEPTTDEQPLVIGAGRPTTTPDDPIANLRRLSRHWRLLVAGIAIGGLLGWLSATVAAETDTRPVAVDHYEAAHVLVIDNNIPDTQMVLGVRNLNALATRLTVGELPVAAGDAVGISADEAAEQIRVTIRPESESIEIVTIGRTPASAERLADAYADEIFAYLRSEAESFAADAVRTAELRLAEAESNLARVRADLTVARAQGDETSIALLEQDEQQFLSARVFANAALLDARADGVPVVPLESLQEADGTADVITADRFEQLVAAAEAGDNVEVRFGDDDPPDSGAFDSVRSRVPAGTAARTAIGAAVGLVAALAIAGAITRLDNRIRSKRQVEDLLDLPVVAEVPTIPKRRDPDGVYSRAEPRTRFAEQYRALASTVGYARRARPTRGAQIVMVTSPGPAEGKTTTVANLGAMLAETGARVLLLNCDFRRPMLHRLVGAPDTPLAVSPTSVEGVEMISHVVHDRDASPAQVIAAQREVIRRARARYDVVLIDTAPLLATNDAVDLLDLVDDVVLVVRYGATRNHAADRAAEILDRRRAHVLGVTITDIDESHDGYYAYGGYYAERPERPSRPRRSTERARPAPRPAVPIAESRGRLQPPPVPSPTSPAVGSPETGPAPRRGRWVSAVGVDDVEFDDRSRPG